MPNVRGRRVVIVGDSLSAAAGAPGGELAAELRAAGATVLVNARVGRSAHSFYAAEASQLDDIVQFQPELAIVWLGTNDCGQRPSVIAQRMAQLRDDLGELGAEVWAFGPAQLPARLAGCRPAVVSTMATVFGPRFIDTAALEGTKMVGRTADGVHFTRAGARALGERMASAFLDADVGGRLLVELGLALGLVLGALALRGGGAVGV